VWQQDRYRLPVSVLKLNPNRIRIRQPYVEADGNRSELLARVEHSVEE
jgi:hypothetical protein